MSESPSPCRPPSPHTTHRRRSDNTDQPRLEQPSEASCLPREQPALDLETTEVEERCRRLFTKESAGETLITTPIWDRLRDIAEFLNREEFKKINWRKKITLTNFGEYIQSEYGVTGYGRDSLRLIKISVLVKDKMEEWGITDERFHSVKLTVNDELQKVFIWGEKHPVFRQRFCALWKSIAVPNGACDVTLPQLQTALRDKFGDFKETDFHEYLQNNPPIGDEIQLVAQKTPEKAADIAQKTPEKADENALVAQKTPENAVNQPLIIEESSKEDGGSDSGSDGSDSRSDSGDDRGYVGAIRIPKRNFQEIGRRLKRVRKDCTRIEQLLGLEEDELEEDELEEDELDQNDV